MKKIITAFIAILYMGLSSGIAMEIHYCMGKKAGMEFYSGKKDKCGKCGMKEKKADCCNDEHQFIKLSDSHKNVSNELAFGIPDVAIVHAYNLYQAPLFSDLAAMAVLNHSPPVYTRPSACILNCVFRL